jgi:hypothetical protein
MQRMQSRLGLLRQAPDGESAEPPANGCGSRCQELKPVSKRIFNIKAVHAWDRDFPGNGDTATLQSAGKLVEVVDRERWMGLPGRCECIFNNRGKSRHGANELRRSHRQSPRKTATPWSTSGRMVWPGTRNCRKPADVRDER